ncbi:RING-H2 finger protein ATL30 [Acorus gramineus]|uniref:RING-H2 finger protein ATL30 n=1 Tax=Acorus gramineus TaxID=55184 RepID=A0AAV9AN58_ACOGR|nr:RING-H2 finger protein ATL30 [Acorus gramineus]
MPETEASAGGGGGSTSGGGTRRYGMQFSASNVIQAPLTALLEYSGILRSRSNHAEEEPLIGGGSGGGLGAASDGRGGGGEVSIRIIGGGDQVVREDSEVGDVGRDERGESLAGEGVSLAAAASSSGLAGGSAGSGGGVAGAAEEEGENGAGGNNRDSSYQRYDIQQIARWIEQILPFSLLLLVVFIRQHFQEGMVSAGQSLAHRTKGRGRGGWVVRMEKEKGLIGPVDWMRGKERWRWLVRGLKNYKHGQMLTVVEYLLLLYRALLPTPVWYRFFLNKEYGGLFSSLTTGLYLTFKLTSIVEKVQSFLAALKALKRKEVHYGSYATVEQVLAAGDLCAICQEKMHAPILLRCKHIFCEDCVSEWFERERTCPLCRALVKPADLRSFGDGSTSLFFQLF